MEFLWAMAITAGMWTWVVKSRGEWNLVLANLAGLGSGLIVYVVSAVVLEDVFDLENPKNLAYSIIALMTAHDESGCLVRRVDVDRESTSAGTCSRATLIGRAWWSSGRRSHDEYLCSQ